jgi:hypothetical protein
MLQHVVLAVSGLMRSSCEMFAMNAPNAVPARSGLIVLSNAVIAMTVITSPERTIARTATR